MTMNASTLRPGLLVSLKTSVKGIVSYDKREVERDHLTENGARKAVWETERVISDPEEHENATRARSKALSLVRLVCARSAFGLLCPEIDADKLQRAIAEARRITDEFNSTARLARVSVYVIIGRVASDDVEAVKAINSEISGLMQLMQEGVRSLDVKAIRSAANDAKNVAQMLSPNAALIARGAIEEARAAASKIVAAGEQAAAEVDRAAIARIEEARTAFLDLDDEVSIAAPVVDQRAVDLMPAAEVRKPKQTSRALEV